MVKLLAVDLDGTLLNEENKISQNNLTAIKHAQAIGIEVVIATGRAHFDVQSIIKDTGLSPWIIGANGATIHKPNGELYHSVPMDKQDVMDILDFLEGENYYYEICSQHSIITPQNGRELLAIEMDRMKSANPEVSMNDLQAAAEKQYSQTGFSFIKSYTDLYEIDTEFYNILAFSFDLEKLKNGWNKFKDYPDLTIVTSAKHNFELEHKNASKGHALEILSNRLNISLVDTAAVGDSYNDLSMLRMAGRSAAMGNAHQEIKNACHDVTRTNIEDGVAHFIYSLTEEI